MHDPQDNSFDDRGSTYESTYYRYVRSVDGGLHPSDPVKHNGRVVPRFVPESKVEERTQNSFPSGLLALYREIMNGLSRGERRTWLSLLLGRTLDDVSQSQRVTRQAIIARIRGNRGSGGWIRKNDYVRIWWSGRNKKNQYE